MDDFDNQLNDDSDLDDTTGASGEGDSQQDGSGSQSDGGQAGSPSGDSSDSAYQQRINDLMSKWQQAEARAKKAEARAAQAGDASGSQGQIDPSLRAWIEAAANDSAERAFRSDPRFEQYGFDASEFKGATPAEIQGKVRTARALIDKMETRMRNQILEEHGLDAEVGSTRSQAPKSFSEMSSKEFNDYIKSQGF